MYAQGLSGDDYVKLSGLSVDTLIDAGADDDRVDASAVKSARIAVYAGLGNDTLKGGSGNDWLDGGSGNDALEGNAGNDVLIGGTGSDTVKGGSGEDLLVKGSGSDWLDGSHGDDNYISADQLSSYTQPLPIIDWAAARPALPPSGSDEFHQLGGGVRHHRGAAESQCDAGGAGLNLPGKNMEADRHCRPQTPGVRSGSSPPPGPSI